MEFINYIVNNDRDKDIHMTPTYYFSHKYNLTFI